MDTLGPVLVVVSRVLVGFSLAFLVPLAWSLALGEQGLARVWAAGFGGTVAAGVALGLATLRFRRELQPKDGFLLVTLVWVALPVSVNVWRCFLQYIGGLGIILLVVAVLPLLGLGGMQLYRAEAPGPMKDARLTPRIAETARGLWTVYFAFSAAC